MSQEKKTPRKSKKIPAPKTRFKDFWEDGTKEAYKGNPKNSRGAKLISDYTPRKKKKHKGWAIVWKDTNIFATLTDKVGDVVSIHKDKPIVSLDLLWDVVEIEFKICGKTPFKQK